VKGETMKNAADLKIAFFDTKPYDRESFELQNKAFGFQLKFFPSHLTEETVSLCKGYDAVCVFVNDRVTKGIIDSLKAMNVSLLALRSAGYNNVDLKAATGAIKISRVPAYSPHGVAEHAVAMMLTLNRKTHRAYYRTRDNNFSIHGLVGFDMYGKTAGIVGTGQIGRIVCEILKGFGMNVIAYDPYAPTEWAAAKGCRAGRPRHPLRTLGHHQPPLPPHPPEHPHDQPGHHRADEEERDDHQHGPG